MERQEMAELGRVLAGATHDLNNVLAVIKEATGLADDALNAGGQPAEFRGRLEKVIGRVMRQVARGTEIITALNRFAHSLDEYRQETSAADVLERVVFLMERSARLDEVGLRCTDNLGNLKINTPVSRLSLALCGAVRRCLEWTDAGDEITATAGLEGDDVVFEFAVGRRVPKPLDELPSGEEIARWDRVLASYGGRIEEVTDTFQPMIRVLVPRGGQQDG